MPNRPKPTRKRRSGDDSNSGCMTPLYAPALPVAGPRAYSSPQSSRSAQNHLSTQKQRRDEDFDRQYAELKQTFQTLVVSAPILATAFRPISIRTRLSRSVAARRPTLRGCRWTTLTRSWSASPQSTFARRTTSAAHTWHAPRPSPAPQHVPHCPCRAGTAAGLCRGRAAGVSRLAAGRARLGCGARPAGVADGGRCLTSRAP